MRWYLFCKTYWFTKLDEDVNVFNNIDVVAVRACVFVEHFGVSLHTHFNFAKSNTKLCDALLCVIGTKWMKMKIDIDCDSQLKLNHEFQPRTSPFKRSIFDGVYCVCILIASGLLLQSYLLIANVFWSQRNAVREFIYVHLNAHLLYADIYFAEALNHSSPNGII